MYHDQCMSMFSSVLKARHKMLFVLHCFSLVLLEASCMDRVSKDRFHGFAIGKKNIRETNRLAGDPNIGAKSDEGRETGSTNYDSTSIRFNLGSICANFKAGVGSSSAVKSYRFRRSGSPATHPLANPEVHMLACKTESFMCLNAVFIFRRLQQGRL